MIYGDIFRQRLTLKNEHVVADTIDYLEMKFNFRTDDWDGLEKWAHFAQDSTVYDIPLTDDCIRKEDHLNLSAGIWKVYLHGNKFADGEVIERITTSAEVLRVLPTGSLNGEPFPEIPASETERILARLEKVEQSGGTGGGGSGLNPVEKTDEMTAEVGADADGRLFTAGTQRGVKSIGLSRTDGVTYITLTLESGKELQAFAPMADIRTIDTAPTSSTYGVKGELLFDETAKVLYVCEGGYVPAFGDPVYIWTAVGGGSGLPEYTDADEGKVLRVVGGTAAWADAPAGSGGKITIVDDGSGNLTLVNGAGDEVHLIDDGNGNLTIGG